MGALVKEMRSVIMGNKSINDMNPVFLDKIKEHVGTQYEKWLATKIEMRTVSVAKNIVLWELFWGYASQCLLYEMSAINY